MKELRDLLGEADSRLAAEARRTLLFVDEIHRFNKAQQDVLLPEVENGVVILVGATSENPFFAINSALISRSRVFQFEPLSVGDIKLLIRRALADGERGLGAYAVRMRDDAMEFLAETSDGDARRALSAVEIGVLSAHESPVEFTPIGRGVGACKAVAYDRLGDAHYDAASAVDQEHSRQRPRRGRSTGWPGCSKGRGRGGSSPGGPAFSPARTGVADPHGLPLAVAAAHACELVGLLECQLTLAQAVTYLAMRRNQTRRQSASARPAATFARAACCRCRSTCATATIRARSGLVTARATSTPTTTKASPRKTTWASSASITGRWIAASSRNWRSAWRRSARLRVEIAASSQWSISEMMSRFLHARRERFL